MATTTISINWNPVKFTPNGGTLTVINRVQSVAIDPGGTLLKYKGDSDRFPTGIFAVEIAPKVTVQSDNIAVLAAFNVGDSGPFEATLNDAKNGISAGGGALKFAIINCVVANVPISGQHAGFAQGTLSFEAYSTDGTTSPTTVTAL